MLGLTQVMSTIIQSVRMNEINTLKRPLKHCLSFFEAALTTVEDSQAMYCIHCHNIIRSPTQKSPFIMRTSPLVGEAAVRAPNSPNYHHRQLKELFLSRDILHMRRRPTVHYWTRSAAILFGLLDFDHQVAEQQSSGVQKFDLVTGHCSSSTATL